MNKRLIFLVSNLLVAFIGLSQTTFNLSSAGTLSVLAEQAGIKVDTITRLKLTGSIDARDFKTIQTAKNLQYLDISEVSIQAYKGAGGTDIIAQGASDGDVREYLADAIPVYAFSDLLNLHTVQLPSPEKSPRPLLFVESFAFENCIALESVHFPSTLKSIGVNAFYNTGITNIVLPAGCESVGLNAFMSCDNLVQVFLPKSINYIEGSFANCKRLSNIIIEEGNIKYMSVDGVVYSLSGETLVQYPAGKVANTFNVLPVTKSIQRDAFLGSIHLKEIILPEVIEYIGSYAFRKCDSLKVINLRNIKSMATGVFGNTIKSIYISSPSVPLCAQWINTPTEYVDVSKINLYVPANLIESYKNKSWFGPKFNYVAWVPTGFIDKTLVDNIDLKVLSNNLMITNPLDRNLSLKVYSVQGVCLLNETIVSGSNEFNMQQWTDMVIVRIEDKGKMVVAKKMLTRLK